MTLKEYLKSKVIDEALSLLSKYWAEPRHLKHLNARTIDEALSWLSQYREEAKIIAGGVDLISLMKNKVIAPRVMVNTKTIQDLSYITEDAEGLKIGVLTSIKDIETSAVVKTKYSSLAEAAHSVASPHIRSMATIAGNLCQDVKCWYYRRSPITGLSFFCHRKGGEQCYAIDGENAYHAIIGADRCHAVCSSDIAPALVALGAKAKIADLAGERLVPLDEFFTPLGNILKPNEIITEIQVPTPRPNTKQRYLKFRLRKAIDPPIASVAVAITTEAGVVTTARIVLGGVAPTPYRALRAEETLKGGGITESVAEAVARVAMSQAVPLSQNAYKLPITETLVRRAIVE